MKKKYYISATLAVFLLLFSIYFIRIQTILTSPENTLARSFNSAGAEVVSAEIYLWGRLDSNKYSSLEDIRQLAEGISRELDIQGNEGYSLEAVDNDNVKKVDVDGVMSSQTQDSKQIVSISIQLSDGPDFETDRVVIVSITQDGSDNGLNDIRKKAQKAFDKYKIVPKVNSCITGFFEGKLDDAELNDIGRRVFKGAEASKVEGIRDNNLISVSAYSPSIGSYVKVNENKVNINLAIRYNSYEDKTYIWLATPVITTEY